MSESNSTSPVISETTAGDSELVFRLPITGRVNGHNGVTIAHAMVLDDVFTRNVLTIWRWSMARGYPYRRRHKTDPPGAYHIKLHQLVYWHYRGAVPAGKEIDHIDRNPLNNLPRNLRAITHSENMANRPIQTNNTSGYVGVGWHKQRSKWQAYITVYSKRISLGLYFDKREAADAVNRAYRIYFPSVVAPNP